MVIKGEKMTYLSDFTTEELKKEIKKRGLELELKKEKKPVVLNSIDFTPLILQCQDIVESIYYGNYHVDNDDDVYMYETAMECVFGKDVWTWINEKLK